MDEKYERMSPRIIQYKSYKKFDCASFNNNLRKPVAGLVAECGRV